MKAKRLLEASQESVVSLMEEIKKIRGSKKLAPTRNTLQLMVKVAEDFGTEHNIIFSDKVGPVNYPEPVL